MRWRKPELICFNTHELICKIKARANSLPSCTTAYAEKYACKELTVGDTWGDGGDVEIGCGILSQCIEVSVGFGCDDGLYCNLIPIVL